MMTHDVKIKEIRDWAHMAKRKSGSAASVQTVNFLLTEIDRLQNLIHDLRNGLGVAKKRIDSACESISEFYEPEKIERD